jgi:hypothetical protein
MAAKIPRRRSFILLLVIWISQFLWASESAALILLGGSEEIQDRGWPDGVLEFVNHPDRRGWWEGPPFGGGDWTFNFVSKDLAEVNQHLETFAAIRAPELKLVLTDGERPAPNHNSDLDSADGIVWSLEVWVPENWHRLNNNPIRNLVAAPGGGHPVPPPTLTLPGHPEKPQACRQANILLPS